MNKGYPHHHLGLLLVNSTFCFVFWGKQNCVYLFFAKTKMKTISTQQKIHLFNHHSQLDETNEIAIYTPFTLYFNPGSIQPFNWTFISKLLFFTFELSLDKGLTVNQLTCNWWQSRYNGPSRSPLIRVRKEELRIETIFTF